VRSAKIKTTCASGPQVSQRSLVQEQCWRRCSKSGLRQLPHGPCCTTCAALVSSAHDECSMQHVCRIPPFVPSSSTPLQSRIIILLCSYNYDINWFQPSGAFLYTLVLCRLRRSGELTQTRQRCCLGACASLPIGSDNCYMAGLKSPGRALGQALYHRTACPFSTACQKKKEGAGDLRTAIVVQDVPCVGVPCFTRLCK
jgi:hypothetical protein